MPEIPVVPDRDAKRFLIDLDNQLSGLVRKARSIRHAVQTELGWLEPEDAWEPVEEIPDD